MQIEWIEVPEGECLIGLSEAQVERAGAYLPEFALVRETPQRLVTVSTFYISRFPVTNAQFVQFTQAGHPEADLPPYHFPELADHPVIGCHWWSAYAFCAQRGARLPSSVEWEKAARGPDGRLYPWGEEWDPSGLNAGQDNRRGKTPGFKTVSVSLYPEGASPYGVEDMVGSCQEWTMTIDVLDRHWMRSRAPRQEIAVRGQMPDPESANPFYFRATRIDGGGMHPGSIPLFTGFRLVIDHWVRQHWPGFRV